MEAGIDGEQAHKRPMPKSRIQTVIGLKSGTPSLVLRRDER